MTRGIFVLGPSIVLLLTVGSLTTTRADRTGDLQPGETAPEINLKKILQAPAGSRADGDSLRGKVVVLEFWATWCAPCIALQPHLNRIAEAFKDKPVQFISITDEDEPVVARFLARRKLKGWVGLDAERSTHLAYDVNALPKTVVIGSTGKIAAITRTDQLNERMLNDLLTDGQSAIPSEGRTAAPSSRQPANSRSETQAPATEPALLELSIRSSTSGRTTLTMIRPGTRLYRATNVTLKQLLIAALGVHPSRDSRISVPPEFEGRRFDVTAGLAEDNTDKLKEVLLNAMEQALGIKIKRITHEMDAYVLTAPRGLTGTLQPSKAKTFHASGDKGVIAAAAADLSRLEVALEMVLEKPVVEETGLKGIFDWNLLYDGDNPKSILEAVRKDFGLEITQAKRPITFFVVEKSASNSR